MPLSLYIHLPWCLQKCPYCDFNSHAVTTPPYRAYVDALLKDLEWELPKVWGRPVRSIFIGGGTPSLFPDEEIAHLLSGVRARLPLGGGPEITLEANPGAVDEGYFYGYRQAGVNRLSIGVQSLYDESLRKIGRIHTGDEAIRAIEVAQEVGFDRVNIDLMFGLPEQSIEQATEDLRRVVAMGVGHLSWYQLTMEPNTPFGHTPPARLPDDDQLWEIQQEGQQLLQQEELIQYEISAYARPQQQCRHNLNYWNFGDYLGIGAGAHSKLTSVVIGSVTRSTRHRNPQQYIFSSGTESVLSSHSVVEPE
ncbi:MAG: radical SAM family heme chaperone HemW, partial [Gammaproteobacteria bacterium]|nr:radical SAM family heme chaperone HemW [Gammaproteobacteria bacterium]